MKQIEYARVRPAITSGLSILSALVAGGVILLLIGKNPVVLYQQLFVQGIGSSLGVIETLIRMAPLLIVSAGLLVAFSAGLWNLGVDGQFIIGAMLTGWLAPYLAPRLPLPVYFLSLAIIGIGGGVICALLPAFLKARYDLNEIITTIMMSFVALNLVSWLVKGPINDPLTIPPQTQVIPEIYRVPMIPFTRIYGNLIVGLVLILAVHWVIRRTTIGFEWRVLFAGKPAAVHVGMNVSRISLWAFLASGGFAGLAGVSDVLSVQGLFKGGWNPSYMFTCIPLVFLARLNGWAMIPLAYFFSFLAIAGEFVARDLGVPYYFVHVLEGLILLFFAASEYIEKRSEA